PRVGTELVGDGRGSFVGVERIRITRDVAAALTGVDQSRFQIERGQQEARRRADPRDLRSARAQVVRPRQSTLIRFYIDLGEHARAGALPALSVTRSTIGSANVYVS